MCVQCLRASVQDCVCNQPAVLCFNATTFPHLMARDTFDIKAGAPSSWSMVSCERALFFSESLTINAEATGLHSLQLSPYLELESVQDYMY